MFLVMHICGRLPYAVLLLVGGNIAAYGQAPKQDSNLLLQCSSQRVRLVGSALLLCYEHSEIVCLSVNNVVSALTNPLYTCILF